MKLLVPRKPFFPDVECDDDCFSRNVAHIRLFYMELRLSSDEREHYHRGFEIAWIDELSKERIVTSVLTECVRLDLWSGHQMMPCADP